MNVRLISGIACVVAGLALMSFSLGVLLNFDASFRWILNRRVVLSPKAQGFPVWRDVSNHFDTRYAWYFFNLTNPKEFTDGAMPILKEVGPFWFRVNLTKRNIVFHENKTVSYEEHREFHFLPELSVLPDTTNITTVNVPLMAAVAKGENLGYFTALAFSSTLASIPQAQNATETYTVRELTYEGQKNSLVTLANGVTALFSDDDDKTRRFGFAVDKNMTNPGIFNMYTGATGPQDLNRVHSIDGVHVFSIWPKNESDPTNDRCNVVEGTLGNLRAPMTAALKEHIFVPDLCHAVTTRYQKDVQWNKLRLRRFNLTIENFQSRKENPDNFCYDEAFRQPSGVSEAGPCKKGAPILMSLPHFLQADSVFASSVQGIKPDISQHEFVMDHDPTTGMTVRVHGRMQANMRIKSSTMVTDTQNLPNVVLPLFWQEMRVEGGPGIAAFLTKVNGYPGLGKIAMTIVALFGLILSVIGAGLLITALRNHQREDISTKQNVLYTKAATTEPRVEI